MYVHIWSFFVPKYVPVFDTKYVTDYKLGITLKFQNVWRTSAKRYQSKGPFYCLLTSTSF